MPRPSTPLQSERIRLASISGDITEVEDSVEQPNKEPLTPELRNRLYDGLIAAIENQNVHIASYLLSRGVEIIDLDFANATKMKSYAMLQLLLDHGWDINLPMGWDEPPALQCVFCAHRYQSPTYHALGMRFWTRASLVRWFLERDAQPDAEADRLDCTAVSLACYEGSIYNRQEFF